MILDDVMVLSVILGDDLSPHLYFAPLLHYTCTPCFHRDHLCDEF